MKYIKGHNRNQLVLFPRTMDEMVAEDNEVRLIDMFVESLDIEKMGFKLDHTENGRPAYHPKDLLKLFIYGYLNRTRSSRELEKETQRNLEVMWLLKGLSPDHNTISNFRKDNPKSIKKVFRATVEIAKNFDLIGGKLLAGDSTKLRAQNSKKNNYNQKKIERHLAYIDKKLASYQEQLAQADKDKDKNQKEAETANKREQIHPNPSQENREDKIEQIKASIAQQEQRKKHYQAIEKQLKESGESQISTTDPESKHMVTRNNITEVVYNVQTTVDSGYYFPIDYKVTNENDSKAMGGMLRRAKTILRSNYFTLLYDKGYHTGSEFKIAQDLQIDVLVAIPRVASTAPNPAYNVEYFTYDKNKDCYLCPEGKELHTTGKWHQSKTYQFKRYTTKSCMSCPVKSECSKAKYGKGIQRSEYQELIELNKQRVSENAESYKQRQAIVEHPYGTIKRQWGFSYIMTKKYIKRAEADVGLIFTSYNFRRLINILGFEALRDYMQELLPLNFGYISLCRSPKKRLERSYILHKNINFLSKVS